MPITKITLENFKGVNGRVEIPLRAITLLFGANSAGKSTILQAMLYMRELLERRNADADTLLASGKSIDLGGFKKLVHRHDLSKIVKVGVSVTVDDDGLPLYPVAQQDEEYDIRSEEDWRLPLTGIREVGVEISVQWDSALQRAHFLSYEVEVNGSPFGSIIEDLDSKPVLKVREEHPILSQVFPSMNDREDGAGGRWDHLGNEVVGQLGYFTNPSYPVRSFVIPQWGRHLMLETSADEVENSSMMSLEHAEELFSHVIVGAGELLLNELKRIRYIGPMRIIPERGFRPALSPAADRWADGSAAWDLLHVQDEDLLWFDEKQFKSLQLGYTISHYDCFEIARHSSLGIALNRARFPSREGLAEIDFDHPAIRSQLNLKSRLQILTEDNEVEVDPSDIGVGVSQLVPVIIGAMAPGYSLLSVEQPELHVHPAIQCRLADVLAQQVLGRERQVLLETHSEHLMLRLLRRVRETTDDELPPDAPKIQPESLSVLYVSNEPDGMTITELPVTTDGDFTRAWPKGFFAERSTELF